jgi:NADP-dependent 3-hydroxy acid dehydrogenase YdfG
MSGALEGKVVAITGASSGIGEATALMLAQAGASVSLGARRAERLESLAQKIRDAGGTARVQQCDVTDEFSARSFVTGTHEELGGLHALVNNAGVMLLGPVENADTEEWRRMLEVNCLGLLYCTHAALPLIRESGGGDIVNVSSVAGRTANLGSAVYNMTKWGVCGFSEALRQEALHSNVRVTLIEPGMVATELTDHISNPMAIEAVRKMREQIGEPLTSEDIASAVFYALTQPPHVSINEILVRPTKQQR